MDQLNVSDEPDMNRLFQLPPTTYVGGDDQCLPFREITRRLEVSNICLQDAQRCGFSNCEPRPGLKGLYASLFFTRYADNTQHEKEKLQLSNAVRPVQCHYAVNQ